MTHSGQRLVNVIGEEWEAFAAQGETRTYAAGAVIFSAGDPGDGLYIVQTGRVRICAKVAENESRLLATVEPGESFGEMSVLDTAPRSASATAEVETTALFLPLAVFLRLLEQRPQLALSLLRELSGRMRALNQKYSEEILQAERLAAIGRFARGIVHDFKNPLAVISLAGELGCSESTSEKLRKIAQSRIEQQIKRMTGMLHELIAFTQPSGLHPKLEPTRFTDFLRLLTPELAHEAAGRNVTLVLPSAPPEVTVNIMPQRLERLFYNLVNNAVAEMSNGGTILLRFAVTGEELQVHVEDTGKGIAPEIESTLFQPFVSHGKQNGTGLGLSICKKIAEDHGGRIWAESTPGRGSTFSFTLPLAAQATA